MIREKSSEALRGRCAIPYREKPRGIPAQASQSVARICITGGIACGKSLAGEVLAELGVPVRDADEVCHELIRSGGPLFDGIVSAFGRRILGAKGEIDRRRLGRIVFSNASLRQRLNAMVHPLACRVLEAWVRNQARARRSNPRCRAVAAVVPLVYETGWVEPWDWVVCVAAPLPAQVERLRRRGMTRRQALARIAAQMPLDEKMRRADYVVYNAGTVDEARRQTLKIFKDITDQMEKKHGRKT